VAVPKNALRKWRKVREFALGMPGATEDFPWGETVAKVNQKVFVFLGVDDGSHPQPQGAPAAELLCDWIEESYRAVAPKRLIAELDGR
jgi:predicted DNA-binding protein (MmcQ/YjbR family)